MSSDKRKRDTEEARPLLRTTMYFLFIIVSVFPFWLILRQPELQALSNGIMIAGAAELAYAFYAFSSGNAAYTMVPSFPNSSKGKVRDCITDKAARIIRAGRYIGVGALILIITGMVAPYTCGYTSLLLLPFFLAYLSISYGACKLSRNISFMGNKYLKTKNIEDFKAWRRENEIKIVAPVILAISSCLLILFVFLLHTYLA